MRIQLHSQCVQTRLGEVSFKALQTQLTSNVAIVVLIRLPGSQNQPIIEPVPEKHVLERAKEKRDARKAIPSNESERRTNRSQKINVHRCQKQAWKKMRKHPSGEVLPGDGNQPVRPNDEGCNQSPGPPYRQRC